jgi:hypothetical protein
LARADKDLPEQQLQPLPCAPFKPESDFGADALRSLVACASRSCGDMVEQ